MKFSAKGAFLLTMAVTVTATAFAQQGDLKSQLAANGATTSVTSPYVTVGSPTTDYYYVNYVRNASILTDQDIEIVDPGTNAPNNICADIYVVTPDEELAECCGCLLTPDQLIEVPVIGLVSNPANGRAFNNATIKIISSAPGAGGTCDAGKPVPVPALRAWILHEQNFASVGHVSVTEADFQPASLCSDDEHSLATTCEFYETHLSGTGTCSCQVETCAADDAQCDVRAR